MAVCTPCTSSDEEPGAFCRGIGPRRESCHIQYVLGIGRNCSLCQAVKKKKSRRATSLLDPLLLPVSYTHLTLPTKA